MFQYGQARVWFAISRDRLLPAAFSKAHPKYKTSRISTWVAGLFVGIPAGVWDIGTLFAFLLVSAGVIRLRRTQPERPRGFRVPLVPWLPILSMACCLVLMLSLPLETWIRFFAWLLIGLAVYFLFSKKRSELA